MKHLIPVLTSVVLGLPALAAAHTLHVGADTSVSQNLPNASFGVWPSVTVRSGTDVRHGYARFDLEPLASLPPGTPIGRAVLRTWVAVVVVPGSIDVHPVLQPWDEGTLTWNTAAALGQAIASVPIAGGDKLNYVTVDVTSLVQDWQ